MNLNPVPVQDRILFPCFLSSADMVRRSGEQASALPIGSVRGTKGSGQKR